MWSFPHAVHTAQKDSDVEAFWISDRLIRDVQQVFKICKNITHETKPSKTGNYKNTYFHYFKAMLCNAAQYIKGHPTVTLPRLKIQLYHALAEECKLLTNFLHFSFFIYKVGINIISISLKNTFQIDYITE